MTERQRFIAALERKPIQGLVPHFEIVFFLTMEVLGKVHPSHRNYTQWNQMSAHEQELHITDIAHCHVDIAEKYGHSAIFVQTWPYDIDMSIRVIKRIRDLSGDKYFLTIHGDGTFEIPNGEDMVEYTAKFYEEPEEMHKEAQNRIDGMCNAIQAILDGGGDLDGVTLCSDYCFNENPFFSPAMFSEFVAPYLTEQLDRYRKMGLYSIKHTDGNIMPILDQLIAAKPDALHSLDPQGHVNLAEVKKLYGDKVCLIGNVNCGLLQTGTDEQVVEDVKRSLREGMPGYGYIFSTSNCVFTGLDLKRYELMHKTWQEFGKYD